MRFRAAGVRRTPYEGTKQAERILRAAHALFVREGAAGFSARRVAREAKLSLGSVQHVFPTSDALLVAMLEYVVTGYDSAYQRMLGRLPLTARARWEAVVDFLVTDIFKRDTRRFFFGFWALGSHHRLAGVLLREAYSYHRDNLATFIAALRPEITEARCRMLATQIAALIEGSMLYTAPGFRGPSRAALKRAIKRSIRTLIFASPPALRHAPTPRRSAERLASTRPARSRAAVRRRGR